MTKIYEFDVSEYLDNEKLIAEYLSAAIRDENPEVFLAAIGHIAKARGMTEIAAKSGLSRESLYKSFAPGAKPRYDTVQRVLDSLGVRFDVTAA